MADLEELFWSHLEDLHGAEHEIARSVERLIPAAQDEDLRVALTNYREETRGQVDRLEKIFATVGRTMALSGHVAGTIPERLRQYVEPDILDKGLIIGVQFLAQYKIAAYRAARRWASLLGHDQPLDLLQISLSEEQRANRRLAALAGDEADADQG